mgnify:FL=1
MHQKFQKSLKQGNPDFILYFPSNISYKKGVSIIECLSESAKEDIARTFYHHFMYSERDIRQRACTDFETRLLHRSKDWVENDVRDKHHRKITLINSITNLENIKWDEFLDGGSRPLYFSINQDPRDSSIKDIRLECYELEKEQTNKLRTIHINDVKLRKNWYWSLSSPSYYSENRKYFGYEQACIPISVTRRCNNKFIMSFRCTFNPDRTLRGLLNMGKNELVFRYSIQPNIHLTGSVVIPNDHNLSMWHPDNVIKTIEKESFAIVKLEDASFTDYY